MLATQEHSLKVAMLMQLKLLNTSPPVRHGRWNRCFEDWRQQIEGDKCSLCGFEYYGTGISRFYYCPNCGAKMDGGAEDATD